MSEWSADDEAKANALVERVLQAECALTRDDLDDDARAHEQEHRDLALDDYLVLCAAINALVFYRGRRFLGTERAATTEDVASLLARVAPQDATSAQLFERGVAVRRWDRTSAGWSEPEDG